MNLFSLKKSLIFLVTLVYLASFTAHAKPLHNWEKNRYDFLEPMQRKEAKVAVLIIAPPNLEKKRDHRKERWLVGKNAWQKYLDKVPDVDCYFIQGAAKESSDRPWIENDTLFIPTPSCHEEGEDRILYKTIRALEFLQENGYTHFFRTNLNSFVNLHLLKDYAQTHSRSFFTGPLWQNEWYVLGYGIFFTHDVAKHITKEYRRLEHLSVVDHHHADDCTLTALATGIHPLEQTNPFRCCPKLPRGIKQIMSLDSLTTTCVGTYGLLLHPMPSLPTAISYCNQVIDHAILYRIREGLSLNELTTLYEYLIDNIYLTEK